MTSSEPGRRLPPAVRERLRRRLELLYGEAAPRCLAGIEALVGRQRAPRSPPAAIWSERDVVLISYADQVREAGRPSLRALRRFLLGHRLHGLLSIVHLLPFFPSSSDDGFSVVDYREVDPAVGDWDDVADLGRGFDLMFDLVLNHCSRRHRWFEDYLAGRPPAARYFIEMDPATDLSLVTRPRTTPLLTPVETAGGVRQVWTTFSDDQIDLDYRNPEVLIEMLDVLLDYVARGARIVRLDAVAFLWKRVGTPCVHLPETHEVVKLMREVLDAVAPGALLLTETNVPHAENVSYLGAGDEAQLVYQFSLPPLLLDAFLAGDATALVAWLAALEREALPPRTTFLNFTASHDGIGVRPLEGLVAPERVAALAEEVLRRGGRVSSRLRPDGSEAPYELNVTWFSALAEPDGGSPAVNRANRRSALAARRFLASQAVMLALRGIPAIYFHSLIGTPNHAAGVERSGRARSINRRKFERSELAALLREPGSPHRRILAGYRRLLAARRGRPSFHPEASQGVLDAGDPALVALVRGEGEQAVLTLANVSGRPVIADLGAAGSRWTARRAPKDLLGGTLRWNGPARLALRPWEVLWLAGDLPGSGSR